MNKKELKIIKMLEWTAFMARMYIDKVPLDDLQIEEHMARLKKQAIKYEKFALKKLKKHHK